MRSARSPIMKSKLLFRADPTIADGRWANNAWLQELPKPLTQLTWENALLLSPQLAAQQGLASGDVIELHVDGRSIRAPVWIMPGQAARSVTLHLGYGRTRAGHVGDGQGVSAYALRRSNALWVERGVQLRKTGQHMELASTQQHFHMQGREPVRVTTLSQYRARPDVAQALERWSGSPPSLYPDLPTGEYAWGMTIDLNTCIGCNACTIACQAENNIPVVGKDQVAARPRDALDPRGSLLRGDAPTIRAASIPAGAVHACASTRPARSSAPSARPCTTTRGSTCRSTIAASARDSAPTTAPTKSAASTFFQYTDDRRVAQGAAQPGGQRSTARRDGKVHLLHPAHRGRAHRGR